MADTPPEATPHLESPDLEKLVVPPAVAMIVLACLSLLYSLVELFLQPTGKLLRRLFEECGSFRGGACVLVPAFNYLSAMSSLAVAGIVLFGSFQMLRRRSWPFALAAAFLMVVPCLGPCCPIGIPVGAWALFILFKPEVRRAMERNG